MHGRKIFLLTILLLFAVILYTSSTKKTHSGSADKTSKLVGLDPMLEKAKAKEVLLYNKKKHALTVALNDYFEKAIGRGEVLGAGVSVVTGDSIVFAGGFGLRNIQTKDVVESNTIFRLGSLSKGFAGVLADMVVQDGNLHWGDKVADVIPEFALSNPENTPEITLAGILSHSSGVPYHSYTNLVESGMPLTEIAERFKYVKLNAKPGEQYSYQNAIFALSGVMINKATGRSTQQALQEKIFEPLGMSTASSDHESLVATQNFATPYSIRSGRWHAEKINQKYYNAIAAGGVNASALDMAKWMRFLLGHNPEVLSAEALAKVFEPIVEITGHHKYYQKWEGHKASFYGLGWRIHEFADPATALISRMLHHGGSVSEYRAEIALFPEEDTGVTILFNSQSPLAQTVVPDLHRIIREIMNAPLKDSGKEQLAANHKA